MVRKFTATAALTLFSFSLSAQYRLNLPIGAIAIDGSQQSVIWISTEGGLFRSDAGLQWRNIYLRPAGQIQPLIRQILLQGNNGQTIFLATDTDDGAIWKTVDGGTTWSLANNGLPKSGAPVDTLVMMPNAPQVLYAKIGPQIYKTIDSGATWTLRGSIPVDASAFTVSTANPQLMYAARENAVYRSRDEGASWTLSQAIDMAGGTIIVAMLVDPLDTNIIYLSAAGPPTGRGYGLYRSVNGGERFNLFLDFATRLNTLPVQLFPDPTGRTVYASSRELGKNLYRTTDKGVTWTRLETPDNFGPVVLTFDPNDPRRLWAGTQVGVYSHANSGDGGKASWTARIAEAKPTIFAPKGPLEFFLQPNSQGRIDFPVRVIESQAWQVPLSFEKVGPGWLDLGNRPVNTPASPQVTVNTRDLEPGIYEGSIRISAPAAGNPTSSVPVKLTVLPPRPGPEPYVISTVAGSGLRGAFGDNGLATRASIGETDSVAVDREGNIYFSETNTHVVRRITAADGIIRRYAGTGRPGNEGDNGPALLANLNAPRGLALDAAGNLYIADTATRKIRKVTPDGNISTLVQDTGGPVRSLAVDSTGNVYIAVPAGHFVGKASPAGALSLVAGAQGVPGFRGDGADARFALLAGPEDVALDAEGNLYIADTGNHRIRKVGKDGKITTIAGTGIPGYQGEGDDALARAIFAPKSIVVDGAGHIIFSDYENQRVRLINPRGAIRTIAGTGVSGFSGDNGPAPLAQVRGPDDLAVDAAGNVIQLESQSYRLRKLTAPPPPVTPQISDGAMVNFADDSPRLAPGALFRLRGTNLAAETIGRTSPPWADELGGVRVTIGGRAAPLSRVSENEIAGQVPFEVEPGSAAVVVQRGDAVSREVPVTISAAAPAILIRELGRAASTNEDGGENSAGAPAAAGSVLSIFFTGQGRVENQPASGAAPASDTGSGPLLPVSATLGELELEIVSVSLMSGTVGVTQLKVKAPGGTPGDYPVRVRVGGDTSNAAIVSIAGNQ